MSARGGQAIPSLDYSLAPYVAKSYVRNCVDYLKDLDLIPDTVDIKKNFIHYFDGEVTKDIEKPVEQNYSIMDHLDEIDSKLNDLIDISPRQLAQMHKVANRRTTEETEQAMEAMVHNLCSMNCLAPDQEFWVYDTAVHQWVIYNAETFSRVFVPGRFYAFSLNNLTGDSEIKPITGAWATFNDKPMVKVTDKSGASFVTTFDHRYLTVTDDCSFDYVQAQNLKYTVHPRNFNLFSEVNYIAEDVSQHVRRNECTIRYKKDYVPYSLALAEFIGYYVGDGYITPDDSTIDFACAEKVYPEHLLDLCEEAFGFVPKYSIHARKNSLGQNSAKHMVITLGVKLNRMIRKLAGTGSANKHIPNFVLHGSWQMQDAFLHGYLMCDGSRKGRNYIEFNTISKPLIDDLRMMFASRGELLHTHLLPARECQQALWTGILGGGAARRLHLQYLVNGANTSFEIPRYNTSHITSKLKEAKIPWGPLPRVPRRENGAIRYEELPQIEMDDALRDTLNPFTKCFKVDVVNIEQAPDCPVVYDIEVADNANFLTASGFIVHNSRAGSQTPFSSVNVGLSTSWEGRTVTHSLLKAVEAGLGLGETAIFPISIFKMKKGVTDKGSPNYDLFQYACRVSAKRLYPNFLSIDAPFNLIHYRKDRPEYQASAMGCVHGTETSLWKLDDEIYVSDFGRMSRILMNKYPLIQYSEISHYMDLEKVDIGIWDSFNNKFAKVKKFIINQNVTDWVIVKLDDESTLTITPDHPLPVEGRGRIRADELKQGDRIKHSINEKLYTGSDEFATVLSIEKASIGSISETTSYDVETETDRFDLDSIFSHNCITGNTRIVLMNPAGRVIYTTASYFRRLGPGVTMLHGWKILSSDGKFVDLINVSIRMETDHVNIIRASHGTIRVTDEHIIPVYRKCNYMELPAKDVQPYDCLIEVPLKDMVKEEDKLQEINLIDLLPANSNLLIAGTPKLAALMADINPDISEEEKAKMLTGDLIPDIELNYYRSVREQLADVINEDELCLVSKKASLTMKPIPVKYKLTREFGRFYGLFYSEGCVNGNLICITNSDPEIIDFAKTYLAALLHREKVTVSVNKNGCSIVSSHSVLLASLFRNNILGVHNGSGDLKLPNWFFFANDEFLKGFLSGVIDGDGSVVPQNYTRIITSSETFAEDIQAVCSRLGYIVSTSVDKQKGKIAHFKDRISIRKFDNYRVTIDNLDVVDMDLHDSIKARKLKGYTRERQYILSKTYSNRVYSIEKRDFNNYVYDFETGDHYFAAGTQKLHNCRTRVIENKVDPQHAITEGRGNLFWTTINFPLIALDAKREAGVTNPIPIFMNKLHEIVNNVIQYSLDRFKVVAKRKAKNYPFMMGQHEYVGSEKLLPNDDIESVIKEGTMAVGFIGLSETLVALIGKHHGESEEAQELGLTILNTMKKWVDEASEKYGYNFGVMASPAEGCTGRLLRITRKKYGVIKGITDKEYFTNSFHICPTYKISAWKKVQLEAPYHAICTSGAISYVELDTDTVRNPQAFEELVNFMADSGCGYFAINHPMTRDPVCGYVGPLRPDGSCPRCGRKEFEGVAVNKLLSLTSYSPDPEYDVRLHENEETTTNTL